MNSTVSVLRAARLQFLGSALFLVMWLPLVAGFVARGGLDHRAWVLGAVTPMVALWGWFFGGVHLTPILFDPSDPQSPLLPEGGSRCVSILVGGALALSLAFSFAVARGLL